MFSAPTSAPQRLCVKFPLAFFLFTSACGYIGGPLTPLANVPATPTGLAATQRGANLIVHFMVPSLTTESVPIKGPLELDLRAGPAPAVWSESAWTAHAEHLAPQQLLKIPAAGHGGMEQQVAEYEFPATAWSGKDVAIAARVIGSNGKASNWTPYLTLPVITPLPKPGELTATPQANGIHLTWHGTGGHFRVLRRVEGSEAFDELAVTTAPEYLDASAQFGKRYVYQVQAFTEAAPRQEAQSELSNQQTLLYEDKFPPAQPTGLRAAASPASIELSWDANTEPDLAGYRVYRSANNGAFEKIADVNEIPTYSDHAVERGKSYRYEVSAIDKSGNESARSAAVEAALQ